jgi:hypothetical protein
MRKRIIVPEAQTTLCWAEDRLDVQALAQVELTSEDSAYPIEAAFQPHQQDGWRAATPGAQTIRLIFDAPQRIRRIHLRFEELRQRRSQEFVLRWMADKAQAYQEIVRQQYNFSPPATTTQVEDYVVDLLGVSAIELTIIPDLGGSDVRASLKQWQLF